MWRQLKIEEVYGGCFPASFLASLAKIPIHITRLYCGSAFRLPSWLPWHTHTQKKRKKKKKETLYTAILSFVCFCFPASFLACSAKKKNNKIHITRLYCSSAFWLPAWQKSRYILHGYTVLCVLLLSGFLPGFFGKKIKKKKKNGTHDTATLFHFVDPDLKKKKKKKKN